MSNRLEQNVKPMRPRRFSGLQVIAFLVVAVAVTAGITFWVVRTYIYPSDFEPVKLSSTEQTTLDAKLRRLGIDPGTNPNRARGQEGMDQPLTPERYTEDPTKREIGLTERELNALLANNTDLARRLAIDLSDDLASAKLLIPVDPDFPVLGGRILRVNAGVQLEYRSGRPVVILRGISVMGVPLPNAWLGNLKNVDLVEQFGGGLGFWKTLADGIDFVQVREGELRIKLKE
jgi:hypothetical protein